MAKIKFTREEALAFHLEPTPGKWEVQATVPMTTQRDLSLAYSPGVAAPCLAIEADPDTAYDYTAKGNIIAVISNGTAVLGLGAAPCGAERPGGQRQCRRIEPAEATQFAQQLMQGEPGAGLDPDLAHAPRARRGRRVRPHHRLHHLAWRALLRGRATAAHKAGSYGLLDRHVDQAARLLAALWRQAH